MAKEPLTPVELAEIERLASQVKVGTSYALLGLDQRAATADVESAYRDFVRAWHPDRFFSRDAGSLMSVIDLNFVEVTRAYRSLRDPGKRSLYDRELRDRRVVVAQVGTPDREDRVGFEVKLERGPAGAARVTGGSAVVVPPPAPSRAAESLNRLRAQIVEQSNRAKGYSEAGLKDYNEGRFASAESVLYLAMQYDTANSTYGDLFKRAQTKARQARGQAFLALASQTETYGNPRDAITNYRKAVECDPEEGTSYFRLAELLRKVEEDPREALALLRKAVQKEPRNVDYRIALAGMYRTLNLGQNAVREAQAAHDLEPRNPKAVALLKELKAGGG